jgi:hypothetical protein
MRRSRIIAGVVVAEVTVAGIDIVGGLVQDGGLPVIPTVPA